MIAIQFTKSCLLLRGQYLLEKFALAYSSVIYLYSGYCFANPILTLEFEIIIAMRRGSKFHQAAPAT